MTQDNAPALPPPTWFAVDTPGADYETSFVTSRGDAEDMVSHDDNDQPTPIVELFTAAQMLAFRSEGIAAGRAAREQGEGRPNYEAVYRAMDLASLYAGSVAMNDVEGANAYSARLKSKLIDIARGATAVSVPAGMALVPVEPTEEMRNAFHAVTDDDVTRKGAAGARWAAMLSAAPSPTAGAAEPPAEGEREAFERWIAQQDRPFTNWDLWRAALAARPAEGAQAQRPLTDEQLTEGFVRTRFQSEDFFDWFEAGARFAESVAGSKA